MGIETLQKAALAAGYAMATPDDNPPPEDIASVPAHEPFRQTGQWLVPAAAPRQQSSARDSFATALNWVRNHIPMAGGGRAPA